MKIPSNAPPHLTTPLNKQPIQKRPKQPSASAETSSSKAKNSSTKQRIEFWCKSIGLSQGFTDNRGVQPMQFANYQRLKEQKRLENLQRVMGIAAEVSVGEQVSEHIDPDWFYSFISMAENIHSPAMQELWGRIFAVEVQRPGSFSLRSLETLTRLTQRDASLFKKAVKLACKRNNDQTPIIITGFHQRSSLINSFFRQAKNHSLLPLQGVSYSEILALSSMKLMFSTEMETGLLTREDKITLKFANQVLVMQPKSRQLLLTYYKLTAVGSELARLLPRQDSDTHIEQLKSAFCRHFSVN